MNEKNLVPLNVEALSEEEYADILKTIEDLQRPEEDWSFDVTPRDVMVDENGVMYYPSRYRFEPHVVEVHGFPVDFGYYEPTSYLKI